MSSLDAVRARFARNEGLPFADILTEASIQEVLNEHGVTFRDRVFSPVTTIWGFLSQVGWREARARPRGFAGADRSTATRDDLPATTPGEDCPPSLRHCELGRRYAPARRL
jgi:hypothetical protein